jgi:sialidase-1
MRYSICSTAVISWILAVSTGTADVGVLDQKVIFRAGGVDGYPAVRIPVLTVTQRGTLLAFCEGRQSGDFGKVAIIVKRSADNGRTWSKPRVVRSDGLHTIGNPCPIVDRASGDILLLHNRNDAKATEDNIAEGRYKRETWITKSRKASDGVVWSKPTQITGDVSPPNTAWQSVGPINGIQLDGQRLLAPCVRTKIGIRFSAPGAWLGYGVFSDDHGTTWHYGGDAAPDADECSMAELADGRVMMVARCPSSRSDKRYRVAFSEDRGKTWSAVKVQPDLPTWTCPGSVFRYTSAHGQDKNRLLFTGPANTVPAVNRAIMTVYLSYDEGRTWPVSKVLTPKYGGYSSLAVLPDKTIACLYETDGTSTITLARFDLKWLTDGKDSIAPHSDDKHQN